MILYTCCRNPFVAHLNQRPKWAIFIACQPAVPSHFGRLLCNIIRRRNLTGSKISTHSTKNVFFGSMGKSRWPSRPLIRWYIFDFSSETAEWNSTKLDRKQDLNVLYQVCVYRADQKQSWRSWPLIRWDIFNISEITEWDSMKLDRMQDLNVLYQVCGVFFRTDQETKIAALVDP